MTTLEDILQTCLGCNGPAFKKDGNPTKRGQRALDRLQDVLDGLLGLGVIDEDAHGHAENEIDNIIEHSY